MILEVSKDIRMDKGEANNRMAKLRMDKICNVNTRLL